MLPLGKKPKNILHESTMSDLWIGATKLLSNGNWNWTDGADFNYKDWKLKEPQNATDLNCASMSLDDDYWASKNCNELKPYVCQILASTPAPTYPPIANCSHGWSYFAPTHSCYGVNENGYIANWTAAETYCQNNDAHLSSIHSYYELQYLTSYYFVAWS
uniref:C-type lectin domain-containing protein n=1 Tax=Panagrolaimus davidi TaxID=227884 RepID=A0A914Q5W2_9BILA